MSKKKAVEDEPTMGHCTIHVRDDRGAMSEVTVPCLIIGRARVDHVQVAPTGSGTDTRKHRQVLVHIDGEREPRWIADTRLIT